MIFLQDGTKKDNNKLSFESNFKTVDPSLFIFQKKRVFRIISLYDLNTVSSLSRGIFFLIEFSL